MSMPERLAEPSTRGQFQDRSQAIATDGHGASATERRIERGR
jgi:hypothetical protein